MEDLLSALHEEIRTHGACGFEIYKSATDIVPGEGSPTADVMLVGETLLQDARALPGILESARGG